MLKTEINSFPEISLSTWIISSTWVMVRVQIEVEIYLQKLFITQCPLFKFYLAFQFYAAIS